jgi:DNA-binding IscR family transcriptional regulator
VVEAVEGPIRLNVCLANDHACTRQGWCPAHGVWAQAQGALVDVLKGATISFLAQQVAISQRPIIVGIDEARWN